VNQVLYHVIAADVKIICIFLITIWLCTVHDFCLQLHDRVGKILY